MEFYLPVLSVIVAFVVGIIIFGKRSDKEKFTESETELAKELQKGFEAEEFPTFTAYLNALIQMENTNDNLISKAVYNRLVNRNDVSIDDILKEMRDK